MRFTKDALAEYAKGRRVIDVGIATYGSPRLLWDENDLEHRLEIGKYCSIGENVKIFVGWFGQHNYKTISTYPIRLRHGSPTERFEPSSGKRHNVKIGNDVWIARDVTILAGVTIGDGAVIGIGSIVTGDVGPYGIAVGSPARILKSRFSEETIQKLLQLRWWDWPEDRIRANINLFFDENFEAEKLPRLLSQAS